MRISVVVPCYNAAPYLAQALGSVLEQTRAADEVIVVDDGSTDGSLACAQRFEAAVPGRIRVFTERAGHASRTRNLGALAATGDALMFLDADDVLAPGTLEALACALPADGVAACPWRRLVNDDGRWIQRPATCTPRRPGQDALSAWLTGWYYPPCSVLWSRSAFEHAGRWDEQAAVNQDGDLMMRALALELPFDECAGGPAYYRRRPVGEGSLSGTRSTRPGVAARIRAVEKTAVVLESRGRLPAYRAALSEALRLIAGDAEATAPDLSARARVLARSYGPSVGRRFARRLTDVWPRERSGTGAVAPLAAVPPDEIRYGLEAAAQVLASGARDGGHVPRRVARPAVTVIVPTYNRAGLLRRAIDSVVAQTYEDFELLVVDDGSTDGTPEIVQACTDRRLRYLRQARNAGVSAARNRGLREARGEFIAFLDSDDEWMPDKLARQVELLRGAAPEVGLVYTGVESVAHDGSRRVQCSRVRGDVYTEMLAANVVHGGGSNVIIRREVVAAAGYFRESMAAIEDYEYWLRVSRFFRVDYIDAPLIRYHDPETPERRSLALRANLDAREWFYRTYRPEMRRAGVAHLFLLKSVRRALSARQPDVRAARWLAFRAVLLAPTSRRALAALKETCCHTRAPERRV